MQVSLRKWERRDRDILAQLANNIKIWNNVRDRLPHPYTLKNADEFIRYCTTPGIPFVLAIEADRNLAGCIGLEMQEDVARISAEIGYWIGEPFWGKGIATKAVALMMDYVAEHFPLLVRIYAKIFQFNAASMKVLEKNGFHLECIHRKAVEKNKVIWDEYVWVKFNDAVK
ncbi:MAG: GNAT family N-acetyltransferase [Chitinophagaceae bacterium]|nr:GNAT family N-acetyltransferase [Chitinophagaceae bacterium]